MKRVSKGDIKNIKSVKSSYNDEIKDISKSLTRLVSGLNSAANFAQQIGDGNLKAEYNLLSNKDILGASLIKMQKSLAKARKAEEEKKQVDERRNWVTHGLAEFGELIRQHNDNMEMFTMNIAKNLVEYVDAAQTAIYINKKIENESADSSDIFELKAAFAYGKPVMLTKTFESGQELLGRVAEENKIIHLKHLPQNYVLLSPGMHDDKRPDNLLIAPIHINKTTMGVIELLSFNEFDKYKIDFVNQLCENIAAVVASVQMNIQTSQLLKQSQYQADELAQHEEEMRQNLEEMQATQEETSKKQEELKTYISTLKASIMIAELDINGRILDISPQMSSVYGSSEENMKGKYFEAFITDNKQSQSDYFKFWDNTIDKGHGKRYQKFIKRNKAIWLLETYIVIKKEGMLPKVIVIVTDKTKEKELIEQLKQLHNK
jgi:methyl-accepting chemotaxis protein